jgi:hypothetical protein
MSEIVVGERKLDA